MSSVFETDAGLHGGVKGTLNNLSVYQNFQMTDKIPPVKTHMSYSMGNSNKDATELK